MIAGFRCVVCGASVDIATPFVWVCPNATPEDRHHVLHLVTGGPEPATLDHGNSFVRFGPRLAWWAFARANGLTDAACEALTYEVAGDFAVTPFEPSDVLSAALGVQVMVKDETGNVAGSHKARHLVSILLHLRAAELLGFLPERAPLAIASCGNAALAAATLAKRAGWPIQVYVPTWMDDAFGVRLDELGASIVRCERGAGEVGDPAMLRFREAVAEGAIPFSVQGPENGYCLDGGRTLGWEMAEHAGLGDVPLDRAFVQVGGGAFGACLGAALGPSVRVDAVQAEGCAPFAAAWARAEQLEMGESPEEHWGEVMQPWPDPASFADGILDDETYDWIALRNVMLAGGGRPIVVDEGLIHRAHELATEAGFDVSGTGSAGLAGALAVSDELGPDDRIAVVMSGVGR